MEGTIFDFLEEYGEILIQILGLNECKLVYGHGFDLWCEKHYETKTINTKVEG